jgi:hypothetical protein
MSYAQITKVPKVSFNLSLVALHAMAGHRLISPDGFAKMVEMRDSCYFCCDDCCLRFYPGYRREDGKWVKPVHWKVPDIQKLINEQ